MAVRFFAGKAPRGNRHMRWTARKQANCARKIQAVLRGHGLFDILQR